MMIIILDFESGKVNFESIPENLHKTTGFSTWFDPETYLDELGYNINNINWMSTTKETQKTIINKLKGNK
tara:strand:- start:730 stop:939 length:210 start_codon:yes stop_codon:yes gene_type:complete